MSKHTYDPTEWEDEVPNGVPVFEITEYDSTIIATAATIEMTNEVVAGTPVNAFNLNHIEEGISNAQETANEAYDAAASAQTAADAAQTAAESAQDDAAAALAVAGKLPHALIFMNGGQEIPNGAYTQVEFTSEYLDTDGFVNLASNNDRITIPSGYGGRYLVGVHTNFEVDPDGVREVQVTVNGANQSHIVNTQNGQTGVAAAMSFVTRPLILNVGDYVGVKVWENADDAGGGTTELSEASLFIMKIY